MHGIVALIHPTCGFSVGLNLILMFNGCLYFFLFIRFYRQAYKKSEREKKKVEKVDLNGNSIKNKEE